MKSIDFLNKSILDSRNIFSLNNYVIFDIETTGIDIYQDDPVEFYSVKLTSSGQSEEYHTFIHTTRELPERVKAMTRINIDTISSAPTCQSVLNEVYKRYSNSIMVAHNCHGFDARLLMHKCPNMFSEFKFLDTLPLAKRVLPGLKKIGGYKLSILSTLFGIPLIHAHGATDDTKALAEVFIKLIKLLDSNDLTDFIKKGYQIQKQKFEQN